MDPGGSPGPGSADLSQQSVPLGARKTLNLPAPVVKSGWEITSTHLIASSHLLHAATAQAPGDDAEHHNELSQIAPTSPGVITSLTCIYDTSAPGAVVAPGALGDRTGSTSVVRYMGVSTGRTAAARGSPPA